MYRDNKLDVSYFHCFVIDKCYVEESSMKHKVDINEVPNFWYQSLGPMKFTMVNI